jgi:GNAT superfamily N-acetyltransferase
VVVWADSVLPFCNAVLLSHPVQDVADLQARIETMRVFLAGKDKPPMFLVCQDWLPLSIRPIADALIAQAGLAPAIPLTGMVADLVLPPVKPLPPLDFRRVDDESSRKLISDINSIAYGFALEYGREAFTQPEAWQGHCYGYVGYAAETPVCAATTMLLDNSLYVGFVATLPDFHRRGYAEAVMRHSLNDAMHQTKVNRTVLHATDEGHGIYRRMGFRDVARFMGYVCP